MRAGTEIGFFHLEKAAATLATNSQQDRADENDVTTICLAIPRDSPPSPDHFPSAGKMKTNSAAVCGSSDENFR
jgi:hypothetical protein